MNDELNDRALLLAIAALRLKLVAPDRLVAGIESWVVDRRATLGEHLVSLEALDPMDHALLEAVIQRQIDSHRGHARDTVVALQTETELPEQLWRINDPALQEGLSRVVSTWGTRLPEISAAAATSAAPLPARFRIIAPFASGGVAELFLAEDAELRRRVLVKRVRAEHAGKTQLQQRLRLEAEIAGRLEHSGIVPVYGTGEDGEGRPYFAMRLVQGRTFDQEIAAFHARAASPEERDLELRRLLGHFNRLCETVSYAHSRGVLHRDVKPANILVSPFGDVFLIDWGAAKLHERPLNAANPAEPPLAPLSIVESPRTAEGQVVGTPAYMSPEQAAGRLDSLGPAADVYCLGTTLYQLLTGKAPFDDADATKSIRKAQLGEFARPRAVKPDVPPALEAVCLKAMAPSISGRYASPRELAGDVERILSGLPPTAAPESSAAKLRRTASRHPLMTAAVAAALAAAIAIPSTRLLARPAAGNEVAATTVSATTPATAASTNGAATSNMPPAVPATPSPPAETAADAVRRGMGLMNLGHLDDAAEAYSRAIALDPNSPNGWVGRGYVHYRKKEWEPAVADYSMSIAVSKAPMAVQFAYRGDCLTALERWDEALRDYDMAITMEPKVAQHHKDRGRMHRARKMHREAYNDFSRALAIAPDDLSALRDRSDVASTLGASDPSMTNRALADLRRAYELDGADTDKRIAELSAKIDANPDDLTSLKTRGEAYFGAGNEDKYLEDLERIALHGTGNAESLNLAIAFRVRRVEWPRAIELATALVGMNPRDSASYHLRGALHIQAGDPAKAEEDLTRAIELKPENALLWNLRGNTRFQREKRDDALADYLKAAALDPKNAVAYGNLGVAYRSLGRAADAIAAYSRAIELDPAVAAHWNGRGVVHAENGTNDAALQDYAEALRLDPAVASNWSNRGRVYSSLELWRSAVDDYSQAIRRDDTVAEIRNLRGIANYRLGRHVEAERDFDRAMAIDPTLPVYQLNRGDARSLIDRIDEGVADAAEAVKRAPDDPGFHNSHGEVLVRARRFDEAIAAFNRACELDAANVGYLTNRAGAHNAKNDYAAAEKDLDAAIEASPPSADLHNERGVARNRQGRRDDALADFMRAVELDPANALHWRNSGAVRAQQGEWMEAEADYAGAVRAGTTSLVDWSEYLIVMRRLGDKPKLQAVAAALLETLGGTNDPAVAAGVVLHLLAAPDALSDLAPLERLEALLKSRPDDRACVRSLALLAHRRGDSATTAKSLTDLLEKHEGVGEFDELAILALALSATGDAEGAKRRLAEAAERHARESAAEDASPNRSSLPFFARTLREELLAQATKLVAPEQKP